MRKAGCCDADDKGQASGQLKPGLSLELNKNEAITCDEGEIWREGEVGAGEFSQQHECGGRGYGSGQESDPQGWARAVHLAGGNDMLTRREKISARNSIQMTEMD